MGSPGEEKAGSGIVYIVDDDEPIRRSLARIVEHSGWTARTCESGAELLRQLDGAHPAAVVLDLSMPVATGIEVQRELLARGIDLPVIFLTGAGTVPIATDALRDGAFDFLEKPTDPSRLIQRIGEALVEDSRRVQLASIRARLKSLSERELEICRLLARGQASKEIARELSISARTVEHHRERILKKTGTANTSELASIYGQVHGGSSAAPGGGKV